jgi:predicted ester cyclase
VRTSSSPSFTTGAAIILRFAVTGEVSGGMAIADALLRGVAVGLTSAGLIATIRRFLFGEADEQAARDSPDERLVQGRAAVGGACAIRTGRRGSLPTRSLWSDGRCASTRSHWSGILRCRQDSGRRRARFGREGSMQASNEEIKALIRRFEDAMNTRRLDLLDDIMAQDFVRHCEATPHLDIRSLEQFKDFLRQDAAAFPDNVQTFTHILADGDLAAVWATYEGTQLGPLGPFPPSAKKVRFSFGGVLRVESGKLAELWITWDNMTILAQLGHLPPAPVENG